MGDIAIKVENLSKYYKLGVINSGTLSRDLQSWLWKKMGKEDPNKVIGSTETDAEGFWALNDLSFEIKKGDRVGIIGKNGAGKSTLLKMLSQISAPTKGKIYIDGKIASLLEVGTGFNPELTGRENIYLNGAILGMKKKEVDRKIDEIIAFSEIEKHIDTPVKRYSSGMYVRLAFAVAAHLDSDILIADEVLAVGDATFQKKALGKMNELSTGEGRTVLFVSHNMAQVKVLCNKGMVLEKGKCIYNGNINEASNLYLLNKTDYSEGNTLYYKSNEKTPKTDFIDIYNYYISDVNDQILDNKFEFKNKTFININGNVKQNDKNLILFVCIRDNYDRRIWINEVYNFKEGNFCIKMELPLQFLMDGDYKIGIQVVAHYKKTDISDVDNILNFSFYKNRSMHPIYTEENFPIGGTKRSDIVDIVMPYEITQK